MNRLHTILIWTVLLIHVPMFAVAHSVNLKTNQVVTLEQIIADLTEVQTVFVGESHDNRAHHDAQLQIIKKLHENGAALGIGLEMFRRDGQAQLDRWVAGEIDEDDFSQIFAHHWSDWRLYREIFVYARDNKIPLLGLNIERNLVSQVARHGFASLTDEQREKLPLAVCNVSERYRNFMRRTLSGHPHQGTDFEHFCEAQILWDASMAENLIDYLAAKPDNTVVVLAGNGHAWKHGIPEQLTRLGYANSRVLLPEIPGRIDLQHSSPDELDYLLQGVELGPLH